MLFKRVVAFLALVLGLLGLTACALGAYAVWQAEARLQRANERAFALADRGLGAVEDRVRRTQTRVQESKITTSEITQGLRDWATREAKDRLVTKLEVESRTRQLAGQLQTADVWLATSTESVRDVQQMLELGQSLGARVDPGSLEEVLETLASLSSTLKQAEQAVDEVRGFATPASGETEANRIARILRILGRVAVTLTEVGPRLERLANRISEIRDSETTRRKNKQSHPVGGYRSFCDPRLDRSRSGSFVHDRVEELLQRPLLE